MSDPQRPYYDPKAKKDTLATKLVRCFLKPAEVDGDHVKYTLIVPDEAFPRKSNASKQVIDGD